jgi:hypothetical protein
MPHQRKRQPIRGPMPALPRVRARLSRAAVARVIADAGTAALPAVRSRDRSMNTSAHPIPFIHSYISSFQYSIREIFSIIGSIHRPGKYRKMIQNNYPVSIAHCIKYPGSHFSKGAIQ